MTKRSARARWIVGVRVPPCLGHFLCVRRRFALALFVVIAATLPCPTRHAVRASEEAPEPVSEPLAEWVDVGLDEPTPLPQPGGIAPDVLEGMVFGPRDRHEKRVERDELYVYLLQKIVAIDLICGLSQPQRQKLELAGRGDLERLFERVDKVGRTSRAVRRNDAARVRELFAAADTMHDAVRTDPFGRNSFFEKLMARTLSPEQAARCRAFAKSGFVTGVRLREGPQGALVIDEVRFPATEFGDRDLARLREIGSLRSLVLDSTLVTDAGLRHLARLPNLEGIDLGNTRIEGRGLAHIAGLTTLRAIDLRQTRVTSEALAHLRGLARLKRLHLEQTAIDDDALMHLAQFASLEFLYLRGTRITDAGLAHLRPLRGLRQLDLEGTAVTDAGLAHLSQSADLELLDLRDTRVTDAGLIHLAGLPLLRHVHLAGTRVTPAGVASLQRSLPQAKLLR